MSAATLAAGAKGAAERTEMQNLQGTVGEKSHGRRTQRLRKLSLVSDLSPSLDASAAPALVPTHAPEKPREVIPLHPHTSASRSRELALLRLACG